MPELLISGTCAVLKLFPEHHLLALLQNRMLGKTDFWSDQASLFSSECYYNCI